MKLIKRVTRPDAPFAIEQGAGSGIWLVPADHPGTVPTRAQVDAITVPHPAGGGRLMLRQVRAGDTIVEVYATTRVPVAPDAKAAAEPGSGDELEGEAK